MKRVISQNGTNEAEAVKLVTAAREKREQACLKELQGVLDLHNCQIVPVAQIGEQFVPVSQVINFTSGYVVSSK